MEGSLVTLNPVDIGLLLPGAVAVCLLAVSALVSGAETSFFSLTPHDIRDIKAHPEKSSNDAILRLLGDVDQLLATILVVNNLVNICIVILAARIINLLFTFGSAGMRFLFESVIATFLLLLFGEIIPKVFAQSRPLRFARTVARPILLMRWLMRPFAYILIRTSSTISEHAARRNEISLDELADAVDMTATASAEEHNMLSGIVKFANTEVQEIMRPRVDVVAVGIGDNYLSVKERIIASGFSRIPVYDEDLDNIKGILYVKDLLPYIESRPEGFRWQTLLREPYYVPESKMIDDLLEDFRKRKMHIAIVVDEYGGTRGIATLEDIIEEIVGQIDDEYDHQEKMYTRLADGSYIFDAKISLGDFCRVLGIEEEQLGDDREAETLAGLVLELKGDFPMVKEVLRCGPCQLTVLGMERHRITRVRVRRTRFKSAFRSCST